MKKNIKVQWWMLLIVVLIPACDHHNWNSPYPLKDAGKNILYNTFTERPKHLDPVQSYSSNEIQFTAQIYEPPLQYHYLKRPYTLIPLSADKMPTIQYIDNQGNKLPDTVHTAEIAYTVYDISIKPGILFQPHPAFVRNARNELLYHNLTNQDLTDIYKLSDFSKTATRELVADDFVFQIKRLAHPRLHSPIYELMADYVVGLREYAAILKTATEGQSEHGAYLDLSNFALEGVQTVDNYTYRIKIKGKYPQFLYWLAMPFFAPVPWEAEQFYSQKGLIERNITLDWYPVGTGPYMLTENNPNLIMMLEKNPNFHGEFYPSEGMADDEQNGLLVDAGKLLPFTDKIIFTREKESIPRWNKFLQGYYDVSGIGSDSFDQAIQLVGQGEAAVTEAMVAQGIRLETAIAASTYYMGFNMLDPVVGGISDQERESARKLRQAISIAVDYEEYVSIFANGRGIPAQGPISPGIAGHRDGKEGINAIVYDWINDRPERKSIETAKALLAEAGYPNGVNKKTGMPLILYFDVTARSSEDKSGLDWMRKQFHKLNIQLVIRSTDYNRFQDKIRKGNAQIFEWGWNADYPDPENFLFLLYGPQRKVGLNGENAANYDNGEYNRLFEQMKNMDNGPERQQIIDRMVAILRYDAPWLWGYHPKDYGLYHTWHRNIKPNKISYNNFKYFRVNPELREQKRQEWNQPVLWPIGWFLIICILGFIPAIKAFRRRERDLGIKVRSSST
ncbi:ABC-type transport system, substrate-binding protein [Nitrosomonas cryotolerans]|uniref:ABC-type transport system, substrate-binding protein n=1 Tax=Nitrosomonas cryotolerans ATCC 49181 TaxID=1131553 RepID=A0A1N6FP21_9PROT|nr:ABC transporter substrate-binding protein [Nitrosomonas cryotolerans]SFP78665.1 ABC-type transport system, substrate-binding protein [Nitrosomonas cryotolerans]SIN97055.1 ABC-type transport system, substrate-binding protein [Nitrosomonas cryotolerans ATCC 49181]